jgi:hypothetical protein
MENADSTPQAYKLFSWAMGLPPDEAAAVVAELAR